ncbi:MAG: peptidylprolyl isomerase [Pyrinomonadaceae bacterium MAG19_C2-C3]|nr:peptidylprolyl isomerase [Pyrinomonadaceae bacterium MAG19_C2-C3]
MKQAAKMILIMLVVCLITHAAHAQQTESVKPKETIQNDAPKKSNRRSAAAEKAKTTGEPFDNTSVAEMAKQCVTLNTDAGDIEIEMLPEAAPNSVRNFLNLAATKAYDGTLFHRTVKDFIIQGGDLSTRGTLSPQLSTRANRRVPDEPNYIKHMRGIVSMARGDEVDTATTSFFILLSDAAHLDNKFAAFGRVTRGIEIVERINRLPADGEKPRTPARLAQAVVASCAVGGASISTPQ